MQHSMSSVQVCITYLGARISTSVQDMSIGCPHAPGTDDRDHADSGDKAAKDDNSLGNTAMHPHFRTHARIKLGIDE